MSRRLRGLRRLSQLAFFVAFGVLFALAVYPLRSPVPVDLFLRADPLVALSAMLSLRQVMVPLLWYALPVVVLGLVLGRVFCGWICPMGTTIDLAERLLRLRGRRPSQVPQWHRVKFYVLIALLVTMLLPAAHRSGDAWGISQTVGLSSVYLVDPLALLTRTFTLAGVPLAKWLSVNASDTVTAWTYSDFADSHPSLLRALSPLQFALSSAGRRTYFRLGMLTLVVFVGIIALSQAARRFWCRNLCPLGALLGLLGKLSPVRLAVSDKCTRCMRCVNECKVGAITEDPHIYRGTECIGCYSCIAVCPENAISLAVGEGPVGREDRLDLSRRRVLGAAGVGLAALVLPKVDWSAKTTESGVPKLSGSKLIRPPGARPEPEFVTACIRCGECMKACPTNTLQPALGEGGLEALGTPVVVPRIGECSQSCNVCSHVCPTRAIMPFEVEEKAHLYLGTAYVDQGMCIAWAADRQCLVCDEACPYNAISQKSVEGLGRPAVNDEICVGCGMCERVCPVQPQAAIRVYGSGDKRHWSREAQREFRESSPGEATEESAYPGL